MHIYDYIIIGSGLTGLTIARRLQKETSNILVLEAQDEIGGNNKPVRLQEQTLNNGLRYFPYSDAAKKSIEFLSDLLGQDVLREARENEIQTYEAGGFKKFLGFGDNPPEFYEQLAYYLSSQEAVLQLQPHEWIQILAQELSPVLQKKSIVTRFGFEGLDGEKPKLTHVIVNGNKNIYAHNFIFAGDIKELVLLMPDDVLNARAKAKLKKSQSWQSVNLDLYHDVACDKQNLFVLNGTTDDDIGPCVGRFTTPHISQWTSFIDSESAEDTENIGLVLKKMKRQIKRAFPEISDSIKKERISVSTSMSGADLKLNANLTLSKVENLWIASSQTARQPNLTGALMHAQLVLSSLGFMAADLSHEAEDQADSAQTESAEA